MQIKRIDFEVMPKYGSKETLVQRVLHWQPHVLSMLRREKFRTRTLAVAYRGAAVAAFFPILVLRARETALLSQIEMKIELELVDEK